MEKIPTPSSVKASALRKRIEFAHKDRLYGFPRGQAIANAFLESDDAVRDLANRLSELAATGPYVQREKFQDAVKRCGLGFVLADQPRALDEFSYALMEAFGGSPTSDFVDLSVAQ